MNEDIKNKLMLAAEAKRSRLVEVVSNSVKIPSYSGDEQAVVEFFK